MKSVKLFKVESKFDSKKLVKEIATTIERLPDTIKGIYL